MTKKKRQLNYTVTLPDHTQRVFHTKLAIHKELGISHFKVDKAVMSDEWIYVKSQKGWIRITVKEEENDKVQSTKQRRLV